MGESDGLRKISEKDFKLVMVGLSELSEFVQESTLSPESANAICYSLTPLLKHANYKIRTVAFDLMKGLFTTHFAALTSPVRVVPNLLVGLSSVKPGIVESASACLECLVSAVEISVWWPQVERVLLDHNAGAARITILDLIVSVQEQLPLQPIALLLGDSNPRIEKRAAEIINANRERAAPLVRNANLPTRIRQRIVGILELRFASEELEKEPEEEVEVPVRSRRPSARRTPEVVGSSERVHMAESPLESKVGLSTLNDDNGQGGTPAPLSGEEGKDAIPENAEAQRPIGILVQKPAISLPFELRDLTRLGWIERMTFLSKLLPVIDEGPIANVSGLELVDCVLTAAFPLHKKTAPLLAEVLSKLLLFYPEALRVHCAKIMEFYLMAVKKPAMLTFEGGQGEFEEVLIAEGHPDLLVSSALTVVLDSQRPIEIERIIVMIYRSRSDTLLPWTTLRSLLGHLLQDRNRSEFRDEILTYIGNNQRSDLVNFYHLQTKQVKRGLRPFIPIGPKPSRQDPRPSAFNPLLLHNRTDHDLHAMIDEEVRKGAKGSFKFVAAAISDLTSRHPQQRLPIFSLFVRYLGAIPPEMITANTTTLGQLSLDTFNDPTLLSILDSPAVGPQTIAGLSRYIWHARSQIPATAADYYSRLYEIFRESESETRSAIIQIALAIEHATTSTILKLPEISNPHRTLITSLISQYTVS
jgi:hypothetical protein